MLILVFSSLLAVLINSSTIYTPQSLSDSITNGNNDYFPNVFFDPKHYIDSSSELVNLQNEILQKNKIYTLIGIIDDFQYSYSLKLFTEEFVQIFYNDNITYIDNSITIILSMSKREIWITTGHIAKKEYNDNIINHLLNKMTPKLEADKFKEAFKILLNGILDIEGTKKEVKKGTTIAIIVSSITCFLILCFFIFFIVRQYYYGQCCDCCYKTRELTVTEKAYVKNLEEFLNNIDKKKAAQNEIYTDNCIICLNSFNQIYPEKNEIETNQKQEKSKDIIIANNNLPLNQNEKQNKENDDMAKTTLECGHSFHKKCIKEWLEKDEKCPLCREQFNVPVNTVEIQKKIINIQRDTNPLLYQCDYYYEGCRMLYRTPPRAYPVGNIYFSRGGGRRGNRSGRSGHSHYRSGGGGGHSFGGGGRHF